MPKRHILYESLHVKLWQNGRGESELKIILFFFSSNPFQPCIYPALSQSYHTNNILCIMPTYIPLKLPLFFQVVIYSCFFFPFSPFLLFPIIILPFIHFLFEKGKISSSRRAFSSITILKNKKKIIIIIMVKKFYGLSYNNFFNQVSKSIMCLLICEKYFF